MGKGNNHKIRGLQQVIELVRGVDLVRVFIVRDHVVADEHIHVKPQFGLPCNLLSEMAESQNTDVSIMQLPHLPQHPVHLMHFLVFQGGLELLDKKQEVSHDSLSHGDGNGPRRCGQEDLFGNQARGKDVFITGHEYLKPFQVPYFSHGVWIGVEGCNDIHVFNPLWNLTVICLCQNRIWDDVQFGKSFPNDSNVLIDHKAHSPNHDGEFFIFHLCKALLSWKLFYRFQEFKIVIQTFFDLLT